VVRRDFGAARTIVGAARANPDAFLRHVERNGRVVLDVFVTNVKPLLPIGRPARVALGQTLAALLALGVIAAFARFVVLRRRSQGTPDVRRGSVLLVSAACVIVPYAASAFIVHPRHHHLIVVLPGLGAVAAWGLSGFLPNPRVPEWVAPLVAALMIGIVPAHTTWDVAASVDGWHWTPWYRTLGTDSPGTRARQQIVTTIDAMGRLRGPGDRPLKVMEGNRQIIGRRFYAYPDSEFIDPESCSPFLTCIGTKQPDVIVVDRGLMQMYADLRDEGLTRFLAAAPPEYAGIEIGDELLIFASGAGVRLGEPRAR
jgi:hypothetical protein